MVEPSSKEKRGPLDWVLGLFSKVEAGESATVLMMMINIFLVLLAYYIIKVVREPLILTIQPQQIELFGATRTIPGGAELKSYGAAGQAIVLMAFVPFYSWFSSRVDRMKLIIGVTVFFMTNIVLFSIAVAAEVPYIGFAFFIWVGIFSLSIIAQFWSYANDIYTKGQGDRLFPIIGIGMTAGPPVGSYLATLLFNAKVEISLIMLISVGVLAVQLALNVVINRRIDRSASEEKKEEPKKLAGPGGFSLILKSRYLLLIAALLFLLNVVNTTGEFILGESLRQGAEASDDPAAFYGAFYGGFLTTVNIAALLIQAFVVSRIVKYSGIVGVVLLLPFISLGAYALIGAGAGVVLLRWAKTAENATDYSVMNTAKGMLWLPTSREEKYKGKQAIDTFIVRSGDVASAGIVALGLNVLAWSTGQFALLNVFLVLFWIATGVFLVKMNKKIAS